MAENENIDIDPENIVHKATIFSNELQVEVVPKSVVMYAFNLLKLSKGMDILNSKLKELDKIKI